MIKILALDLAKKTGWAMNGKGPAPFVGTWDLPGFSDRDTPRSLASIYSAVREMVTANAIEIVAIEAPLILPGRSAHTERSLVMLCGAAIAGAINGGAKHIETVAPNSWRKVVLGNGRPDDPKGASLRYCASRGWKIEDHNASDAACVLVWAQSKRDVLQLA